MHKTTHNKMKWFKDTYLNKNESLEILDVGSLDTSGKNFNYKSIFNENNWNYTGLDFQNGKNVDILVDDIYNWFEIEDNSYDVIISGQLFEHLEYFWLAMGEIERVLNRAVRTTYYRPHRRSASQTTDYAQHRRPLRQP